MAKISNSIEMMNNDVCFQTEDNRRFRLRAAAIIIENGCVLFATNDVEKYYYSIGGAIELGETAEQAVLREVYEETGVHYEVDRLAVIHENFFEGSGCILDGLHCHEIAFFYLMKPRGTKEIHSDSYTHGVRENMYWIPIKDLHKYTAFPSFLKDYLSKEHLSIEHIVTDERV